MDLEWGVTIQIYKCLSFHNSDIQMFIISGIYLRVIYECLLNAGKVEVTVLYTINYNIGTIYRSIYAFINLFFQ